MRSVCSVLLLGYLLITSIDPLIGQWVKAPHPTRHLSPQGTPLATMLNINRVAAWYNSDGEQERIPFGTRAGNGGLSYPRGTAVAVFSSGLIWGGRFRDGILPTVRVNGQTYGNGTKRGAILGLRTGITEDVDAADVRIWRIRGDYASADLRQDAADVNQVNVDSVTDEEVNSLRLQYEKDWKEWPAGKGAPFYDAEGDGMYTPQFYGNLNGVRIPIAFPAADEPGLAGASMVIWSVANDIGVTQPWWRCPETGMEIQTTVWGYARADQLGDAIFKRFRLFYKGTSATSPTAYIDSMYVSPWADPDLGDPYDDFVGCDTVRNLGYVYNGRPTDVEYANFGLVPPAGGYDLLQGPLVQGLEGQDLNENGIDDAADFGVFDFRLRGPGVINLPMTSFVYHPSARDPQFIWDLATPWYQMLRGLPSSPVGPPDPDPLVDPTTGQPTVYWLSGNPMTRQGWLDGTIDLGGDRRIVLSTGPFTMALGDTQEVILAWVGGLGRHYINSVSIMKYNDNFVQATFDSLVEDIASGAREEEHVPWGCTLEQNYPNPFNPSTTIRYGLPQRSHVTLAVFNALGQQVAVLVDGVKEAGYHEVQFNGSALASCMYFYRLQAGQYVQTRRCLLLQ